MAILPFSRWFGNYGAIIKIESHQKRKVRERARTDIMIARVTHGDKMGEECHIFLNKALKALDKGHVEPAHISRLIDFLEDGAYPTFLDWSLIALSEVKNPIQQESILDLTRSNAEANNSLLVRA